MSALNELNEVLSNLDEDLKSLSTEEIQDKYLSRKRGLVKHLSGQLKDLPKEEIPEYGKKLNELNVRIKEFMDNKEISGSNPKTTKNKIDFSRPAYSFQKGTRHPISIFINEAIKIFEGLGFEIWEDAEIDNVTNVFDRLRTPDWHPARDTQDTFYVDGRDDLLLRTHTTATQPKVLDEVKAGKRQLPIKVISVGKVYRSDAIDATHTPMFHQIDGFMVDEGLNVTHLKGVLESFIRAFVPGIEDIRFRPHYFGYTEPSLEVDTKKMKITAEGKVEKSDSWGELLGSGMMHPELFEYAGLDPKKYTGFAFGMGVERLVMQRYGIHDIRLLFDNNLEILQQITR